MATLISLGARGLNLDAILSWRDLPEQDTLTVTLMNTLMNDDERFIGVERARMLRALTLNSMEYGDV